MAKKWKWLLAAIFLVSSAGLVVILVGGNHLKRRFEPYIRQQAIEYLSKRFESDAKIESLKTEFAPVSPVALWVRKGRGTLAHVAGENVSLSRKGRTDLPPLLSLKHFSFDIDLGSVLDASKEVSLVSLDGLELNVPPKGDRETNSSSEPDGGSSVAVTIREVVATNTKLNILPKNRDKKPLVFNIARLRLQSVGKDSAMKYEAELTNPKPPGQIQSNGTFGPWNADDPGNTPLAGAYTFNNADLSVFKGIAGILNSKGKFEGVLSSINARGTASVPDFRLKRSGNAVPLTTEFETIVDGGNGNTILQPVHATLGKTKFITSGAVVRKDGDVRRSISLEANMPAGDLADVLRLAMKGKPFMEGQFTMRSTIVIPPLTGKVPEKLILDGQFAISKGKFLRSEVQEKVDSLSRRGQGQPDSEEISEVFSDMKGQFHLQDKAITFRSLSFNSPGAAVNLTGNYDMGTDALDFHGSLALDAKVSETMTGWKRWALKPLDPFFAKNGAGTFLRIKIDGTAKDPSFGLDRGPKPASDSAAN